LTLPRQVPKSSRGSGLSKNPVDHLIQFCVSLRWKFEFCFVYYYESRKREIKTKPIYECRCDEGLKTKTEKSTLLTYTGLSGELEHLKIKTRLIDEKFPSVIGLNNKQKSS
jgi:hypothetical protein